MLGSRSTRRSPPVHHDERCRRTSAGEAGAARRLGGRRPNPASGSDGHHPRWRPCVVEHHGEADVVLVDGESIDQYGASAVTLGRADCGQAGALPADATAVQIDAALLAAAAGLIVRVPSLPSPSFEALDDSEAPLLTPRETDVLAAIADGLSNKAAARRLCSGTGCGACLAFQSR